MKLVITFTVDPDIDPSITDPHEIAESLLASYERDNQAGWPGPALTMTSAEWSETP